MKRRLLAILRVPERPDPPPGADESLRVFRASEKFFYLSVVRWLFKQAGALFGLLLSLAFFGGGMISFGGLETLQEQLEGFDRVRIGPLSLEGNLFELFSLFEIFALGVFVVQFVLGALLLRLAWEMRWYMISDQSLRIRHGLLRVHEQTMTVANIQNMTVRQGPLQKLLGIADLEVHTAGGGATGAEEPGNKRRDLHIGRFEGIEDVEALRDRLRSALAKHRDAGLGDPEDHGPRTAERATEPSDGALLPAACALADEARALRQVAQALYG